jgi:hypothetical protein
LLFVCMTINVPATVVVASRDTHVSTAAPSTAFGASETLQVSAQSTTFLWHDVGAVLPANTRPGDVVKAALHLWISKQSLNPRGSFRVVPVQTSWLGAGMTYHSGRPVYPLTSAVAHTLGGGANHYFVVDVTDIVKTWVTAPTTNHGFAILAADNSINVLFGSKENQGTAHPPLLDITLLNATASVSGPSFSVCTRSFREPFKGFQTCNCSGKTLSKFATTTPKGSCFVRSDLGSCSMMVDSQYDNTEAVSCCVCAP